MKRFTWMHYSQKLIGKIRYPRCAGAFHPEDAQGRKMRLATGRDGSIDEGAILSFSLLVDETDGIIADAKFHAFGPSALIGIAEACCELMLRKNYEQARRISADLIERHLRDKTSKPSLPSETFPLLNLALSTLDIVASKCMDIPIEDLTSPVPDQFTSESQYPNFDSLENRQKLEIIEKILHEEIRPYIELDEGGIEIIDLEGSELRIRYQGACTTCPSSTGATLGAIQGILQAKLSKNLTVIPDLHTIYQNNPL